MAVRKSVKILTCKQEIMDWIGNCSDHMFKKYVALGMPARYEDGRWTAHGDNIDEFFRRYTRVTARNFAEKEENGYGN